jgi:hypothetical protein
MTSGTQDIAALSALLFSGSVERNALATHLGLANLSISQLSLLGMLGMVKSALKIALGNERCQAAGFGFESLRGIFGYTALEADANPQVVECDVVRVEFESKGTLVVKKVKRYFHPETNPLLDVAAKYGTDHNGKGGLRLTGFTALNLGDPTREGSWGESIWIHLILGILCTGITAWLLILVDTSWTWVRFHAMLGMQVSLLTLLALPLAYMYQTRRPGTYLTIAMWNALSAWKSDVRSFDMLQCRIGYGDVLHAQANSLFLHGWPVRILALVSAISLVAAYVCQYAVLRQATDKAALMWLTLQAAAALLRSLYWLSPSVSGSAQAGDLAELREEQLPFALIRNSAPPKLTLAEIICACQTGSTRIPLWAWTYLRDTNLEDLIREATSRGPSDIIPFDVEWYALRGQDFNRIVRGRLPGALDNHTHHAICLGLWRSKDEKRTVHPFFLVETKYLSAGKSALCHMEANTALYYTGKSCTFFAFDSKTMKRLHIRPLSETGNCCPSCEWGERTPDSEREDTSRFLLDRARMTNELLQLVDLEAFDFEATRQTPVMISAGADFVDREGFWDGQDYEKGVERVRECISGKFRDMADLGPRGGKVGIFGLLRRWSTYREGDA